MKKIKVLGARAGVKISTPEPAKTPKLWHHHSCSGSTPIPELGGHSCHAKYFHQIQRTHKKIGREKQKQEKIMFELEMFRLNECEVY